MRQVYCRFGDIDEVYWAFKGLPQGSVLSPLLYAIYVKDLTQTIEHPCKIIQYADDIAIYSRNPNIRLGLSQLEACVQKVISLDCIGLNLSSTKTKLCIFLAISVKRLKKTLFLYLSIIIVY